MLQRLTNNADDEPMLAVSVNGKPVNFLVDCGASMSAINPRDLPGAKLSTEIVNTVGVAGIPIKNPLSVPLTVELGPLSGEHAFLMAADTPLNLLGRDLLCQFGCTIKCTPDGVYLDVPDVNANTVFSMLQRVSRPTSYAWQLSSPQLCLEIQAIYDQLTKQNACPFLSWLKSEISNSLLWFPSLYCPAHDVSAHNPEYIREAEQLEGTTSLLHTSSIYFGHAGIVLEVQLSPTQKSIFQNDDCASHPSCRCQQLQH